MADSDDEYDRKRRDKFRGERSTGSDSYRSERRDDRRTGISSVSGSGGRDDWSERNPFRGGGGAGRPRADFRDFNRPPRERYGSPVRDLPPAKRMRGDWGDDLRSAIPRYGGYDPYLMQAWNEHYAHSLHSAYAHAGGAGSVVGHGAHPREPQASAADMQTQPPMMTLKQFLDTQDDGLSDAEVLRKYSEYKLEFKRQQLNEFFVSHKDEEWFKNKYHPLDSVKRKEEQQSFLQNRVNVFHELLQNGQIKAVSVDTAQTDPLLRLLDTVVIKLEGGTDDDLKILDEKPKDPPQFPERTFQRKNVEQDDDVIITAVGKKFIDKPVDDDKERKEREVDRKRERVQEEPRVISPQPMRRRLDSDDEENWDDDDDAPQLPMKINEPEADIKREIKERELDDDDQSKKAKSKKSLKRKRSDSNSSQSSSSSNSNSDSSSSSSSDEDDGGDADKQDKYNLEDLAAEKKIVEGVEAEKELEGKDELAEKAEETIEKANEEEDHAAKSPDSMRSEASEEEAHATNEVETEKVTDDGKNVALKAENGEDEDEMMKTANVESAEDNLSMHSTDAAANEGVAVKTEIDDQTTTTAAVKTEALEEGETKNDADDEDAVGKKATEQEQPETIDLDKVKDGPQPRALHRTSSIFLRNLAPSITKEEIENICKAYEGYLRVAIADPLAERRWYRRGWVTFKRDVNIKEICWNLNNMRIKDCEMGAIVNRDLSRRVRPVNGMTAHKAIVRADIRLCAKIALNLDEKFKLWEAQAQSDAAAINGKENEANGAGAGGDGGDDGSNKPTNGVIVKSTNNASTSNYGFKSNNPVLQNITDFLIEEASAEEEELLGLSRDGKDSDGENIERDPQLIAVLDNLILYLRIVHSVDFYNHCEYPYEDEMPNRCGIIHARGPAPARITQNDIQDYIKNFETKMQPFLTKPSIIEDEELKNLGAKDTEAEVEKFIQANSQELAKDKWLCPLSGKKFKGPEFIRKHIFNKHAEKVEEVRKEVEYFNNYLRDPKRPQLPEHPGATKRTNSESSSGAATAGYRPPAYPPPYAPPYAAYAPPIMMPGRGRGGYGGGRRHGGGHFNEFRRLMHYRDLDAPQD